MLRERALARLSLILVSVVAVAGCAAVSPSHDGKDAELKWFSVAPDRAALYVYRTDASPDNTSPTVIQVDGRVVGHAARGRYVYVELPPGDHWIQTSGDASTVLAFVAQPGTPTFVREDVPALGARHLGTRLRLVPEAEGRTAVQSARLSGEPYVLPPGALPPVPRPRVTADTSPGIPPATTAAAPVDSAVVREASERAFAVDARRALLFVYRDAPSGTGATSSIVVDGEDVGAIAPMSHVKVELPPGRHSVRKSGDLDSVIHFYAGPGSLTFLREEDVGPFKHHGVVPLRIVDNAEGRLAVLTTRLSRDPYVLRAAPAPVQTLQVRVELEDAPVAGPVDCEAANDAGRWPFKAPGPVTVTVSLFPLQVRCQPPDGTEAALAALPPSQPPNRADQEKAGFKTGAAVGAGIGVGLAIAAYPMFGPAALAFVAGSTAEGAKWGRLFGTVLPEQAPAYPDPLVLKLKRVASPPDGAKR